jgi:hypothetical protein
MKGIVKLGERVELVRWTHPADGPVPVTVSGEFLGCSGDEWHLVVGDEVSRYDRSEWVLCLR